MTVGRKKDVNLVLEGGGVKGVALAGAIAELTADFDIKRVAGASVGAVVAALIAVKKADQLEALMHDFPFDKMRSTGRLRGTWSLMTRGGMYPIDPLRAWLMENLESRTFGDLRDDTDDCPRAERRYSLMVTATDVTRGELVHLPWDYQRLYGLDPDRQLIADAVCASAAFPFFFVPQKIEPRLHASDPSQRAGSTMSTLIDGGVLSNFPIEVFHAHDGGRGVETTFGVKLLPRLPTPVGDSTVVSTPNTHLRPLRLIEQMIGTMVAGRDQARLEHPSVAKRVIRVDTSVARVLDFNVTTAQKAELIKNGRDAAATFVARWKVDHP